jgi:hypothetical protein
MPATKTDPLAAFMAAYEDATRVTSDLRAAYATADSCQRALVSAIAEEREDARVAFVAGRDHTSSGAISSAQAALDGTHARLDELKLAGEKRQAALASAVRDLIESGGRDALADSIGQLIEAGCARLALGVDEVAASRKQLATTLSMFNWLDGAPPNGGLLEANAMSRVEGLQQRNGDIYGWDDVEGALRGMGRTAERALRSVIDAPPAKRPPRVSDEEMLSWHLAAGGDFSDSTSEVRDHYLEHGPRRAELAVDLRELETGRTRDQRTWT